MKAVNPSKTKDGLRVVAYAGDNKILIAMSLDDAEINDAESNLAGFAIWRSAGGKEENLPNRLSFDLPVTSASTAQTRRWTPSDQAPFQKFRWVDVPPTGFGAPITYRVQARYFTGEGHETKPGPEVELTVNPATVLHTKFRPAFTRGYIASQAYADKFHNADIRPNGPKTPRFDTKPYQAQYQWLGADAREELFKFIDECNNDASARLDVFAYDLDEPDVIAAICNLGKTRPGKVRAILDNAPLHTKPDKNGNLPPEVEAATLVKAALGAGNVKQGHFSRYQHNKVFIKRDAGGRGQKVIFGSMNFSVRGLYVQANNVIAADDPATADMFARAFDLAFADNVKAAPFRHDKISAGYMTGSASDTPALPKFSLALSPHTDWQISLGPMAERMRRATSSVLFAVMAPTGKGPVLATLREIAAEPTVFSYGTVETDKGLAGQSPNGAMGDLTGFAALRKNVPPPFDKEFDGGPGMHIHDKFVVVDFNADDPVVFTGSSNLAAGGEEANGDSLVMIEDAAIANMYAIEAIAVFDHYHFRKAIQNASKPHPLTLWYPGKPGAPQPWWRQYYDETQIQMRDRYLFAGLPLPAGLEATKAVDWSALDAAGDTSKPRAGGAAKRRAPATPGQKRATAAKRKQAAAGSKSVATRKRRAAGGSGKAATTRRKKDRGGCKEQGGVNTETESRCDEEGCDEEAGVRHEESAKRQEAVRAGSRMRRDPCHPHLVEFCNRVMRDKPRCRPVSNRGSRAIHENDMEAPLPGRLPRRPSGRADDGANGLGRLKASVSDALSYGLDHQIDPSANDRSIQLLRPEAGFFQRPLCDQPMESLLK